MTSSAEPLSTNVFDDPSLLNLTRRQSKDVLPALLEFLTEFQPRVGQILSGIESGKWTRRNLRHLERLVIQNAPDSQTQRGFLRVLRKACAFWVVRERSNLALPRIPVLVPEQKNPFRHNFVKMLERYAGWKHVLELWLRTLAAIDTEQHNASAPAIEILVVSAVLYGGLHNIPSLLALLRAVPEADSRTFCVDGRMHVELSLSWRGIKDVEFRRWQPDPLTATLWSRIRRETLRDLFQPLIVDGVEASVPDKELTKRLDVLLRSAMERTAVSDPTFLGGISRLLQAAQTAAYIELPPILAAYAGRKLVSHSLQRSALRRLSKESIPSVVDPPLSSKSTLENDESCSLAPPSRVPEDLEPPWLIELRELMCAATIADLRSDLVKAALSSQTSPFAKRMADFCDSLAAVRTAGGKMRTTDSAKAIVIELARSIGPFVNPQDPADLSTEALETVYMQMIESTGVLPDGAAVSDGLPSVSKRRRDLSRAIMEFHRYMMARHNKEPIEDMGLLSAQAGLVRVNANPLTLEDYIATLDEIDNTWPDDFPERKRIARILVILCFRCGLRRLEALHLFIEDLLLGAYVELLIRPSEMRKVKSRNAKRRLALLALLTKDELKEILAWRDARVDEVRARRKTRTSDEASQTPDFLFASERENLAVVPQSIIEQINLILIKVTGDKTMHLHQLRHSFATWTWLRLMLADMENPPDLFPHLEMTTAWLREGSAFRKAIYLHEWPTRKHAYLVAELLGHGSPFTSVEHYIHLVDWLLAAHLERSPLMHPKDALIKLASGTRRSTLQRWESNGQPMAVPLKLWSNRTSKQPTVKESEPPRVQSVQTATTVWPLYDFLRTADTVDRPREEVFKRFGFDERAGCGFLERVLYLRDLPSGNSGSRPPMEEVIPDLRNPQQKRVLACPRRPDQAPDKQVIEHFSPRLATLACERPELVRDALDCYVHRVWHSRGGIVVLHSPAEANEALAYIEFLTELGIARKDIRWFSFRKAERSRHLAEWKRILGLNRHNAIERLRPPNDKADSAEAWFGIAPRLDGYVDATNLKNPGAFGFRFLMLMGFIAFGRSSADTSGT